MDNHISFVQATYNNIRAPVNWVLNRVSSFMGLSQSKELPEIEDTKKTN